MSTTYKKKVLPVTAIQWDGKNSEEVFLFAEGVSFTPTGNILLIETAHSTLTLKKEDYVVKEGKTFWSMSKEGFESQYEKEAE